MSILHEKYQFYLNCGCVVVTTSASKSVNLDSAPLSSHTKNFQKIPRSSTWPPAIGEISKRKYQTEFSQ